jgi:hypothetical protein
MRRRIGQLFSLAAAAFSLSGHFVASVTPAMAAREVQPALSCFTGVDFGRLSVAALTSLVNKAVSDLSERGKNNTEIVATIGAWMALDAKNCTPAQANALMRNVAAILVSERFPLPRQRIYDLLHTFFFAQVGAVAEPDVETRFPTVYGLG